MIITAIGLASYTILRSTDEKGNTLWNQTFGSIGEERPSSVISANHGGYVIAGATFSSGAGSSDALILKIDEDGNELWYQTYGGSAYDAAKSVISSTNGGFLFTGMTESFGAGEKDIWIVRIDENGNELWSRTFGGPDNDEAISVIQDESGDYVIAGRTYTSGAGGADVWVIKIDEFGNELWNRTYGGAGNDWAESVIPGNDGGYVIAGRTSSYGAGGYDSWILKIDENGNEIWDQTFGGDDHDYSGSVISGNNIGYVIAGGTLSYGSGRSDVWILKIDENGFAPTTPD